jgi:uncharacterized protein YabE (DUF348 family)/3D (Asp-Asp-Asp) domain-containing protein
MKNAGKIIIAVMSISIVVVIGIIGYIYTTEKTIVIVDGYEQFQGIVYGEKTVKDVLNMQGIELDQHDVINKSLGDKVKNGDTIEISRGIEVRIYADNKIYEFYSTKETVGEVLWEAGISLNNEDICVPDVNSLMTIENSAIEVTRVNQAEIVTHEIIPYEVEYVENPELAQGEEQVAQEGYNGSLEIKESVTYENGSEIAGQVISETVVKEPVNKIIEVGTYIETETEETEDTEETEETGEEETDEETEDIDVSEIEEATKVEIVATAYTEGEEGVNNTTASGTTTYAYHTIAADSSIPFGTRVYIPYFKEGPNNGIFVVEDRGSDITGKRIDIYFDTIEEVYNFGRKELTIYILPE